MRGEEAPFALTGRGRGNARSDSQRSNPRDGAAATRGKRGRDEGPAKAAPRGGRRQPDPLQTTFGYAGGKAGKGGPRRGK